MKEKLSVLVSVSAICLMCLASPAVIEGCRRGLLICWELILPSLFPFFLLSILLGKSGFASAAGAGLERWSRRLFGVGGEGATALLLGLTGGYPMGAAYLRELEKRGAVSPEEGGRLLRFCNNSGPAFLVGALGIGVFGSRRAGFLLWLSHALAAVTAGLLFRRQDGAAASVPSHGGQPPFSFRAAFPEAVREAVTSCLTVCGFVVCFSAFTGLLRSGGWLEAGLGLLSSRLPLEQKQLEALFLGFFELGGGVGAMQGLPLRPENLALGALLVGWGGVSVQFQTLSLLADSEMKSAPHLTGRLLSAILGAFWAYLLSVLLL